VLSTHLRKIPLVPDPPERNYFLSRNVPVYAYIHAVFVRRL
jgi:hypothetical protein